MIKPRIGFSQQATSAIKQIVRQNTKQQLSGLTPTERAEILRNILVTRHRNGSSLKVHIATNKAVETEFGTSTKPARPWVKKLQRSLATPVRAVLSKLLNPKE